MRQVNYRVREKPLEEYMAANNGSPYGHQPRHITADDLPFVIIPFTAFSQLVTAPIAIWVAVTDRDPSRGVHGDINEVIRSTVDLPYLAFGVYTRPENARSAGR